MITIIDYGLGNIASVERAFNHLNVKVNVSGNPNEILKAEKLVLPGVGAFGQGMENLSRTGLDIAIQKSVKNKVPLLGICLGMQLLFSESEELGVHKGLDLIPGRVVRLNPDLNLKTRFKVPHVGWSGISPSNHRNWSESFLKNIPVHSKVYFVHSFAGKPEDDSVSLSGTEYGGQAFCSAVQKGNIMGSQFHPEKSGPLGLGILKNFIDWRI